MAPVSYLETSVLLCDDNLSSLPQIPTECVDLIYLDPPFFSNRQYEVIWGDESEMRSFRDRWKGGISNYIDWMRPRAHELHRILKSTGSLYFHCDPHASHYLKVMLDGIFGANNFRNEIIWHYSGWNKRLKRKFESRSDNILFYAKGSAQFFQSYSVPWESEAEYVRVRKQKVRLDEVGRKYVLSDAGGGKRARRYLDEAMAAGVYVDNVWGIDKINNSSREREGYPTQKPEALLERIIAASSRPGDVVLDPFCGCGTTVAVASRMQRKWLGMDISPTAMRVIRKRLQRDRVYDFRIEGMPETESDLRELEHFEFQNWVIDVLHGKHSPRKSGDMGIDGFSFLELLPIQVKQVDRVGRQTVDEFETAVRRDGKNKGFIVAFDFTNGAWDEVARARNEGLEIGLVRVADLLDNPHERPLRANLPVLTRELLELARMAAAKASFRYEPPALKAEELAASMDTEESPVG